MTAPMPARRRNRRRLWWLSRVIIPASIAFGIVALLQLASAAWQSPREPWAHQPMHLLLALAVVAAIGRLAYRMARLRRRLGEG